MRITIHRGKQIGGCITEIVSSMGTRIFVDLGHNLPKGDEESEDEFASEEAIADLIGDARAIFYTHMHGDHVELFQYVPDGVDQYIGRFLHAQNQVRRKDNTAHRRFPRARLYGRGHLQSR